jgi:hypothetical protein
MVIKEKHDPHINFKKGKIYKFKDDYVLVVKKSRDREIDRVAVYSVLFSDGTIDTVPVTLIKPV